MRNYTATALSAVLLGLTIVGFTSEAEASRRKPRRPIVIGEIQQISETFVILNDSRVELTSRTVYQDYADRVISRDAFAAGDCVKVKLIPGRLIPTAKEMEMEDRCTAGSGTGVVKPSPGIAREDKGGCRGDGIDAGRKRDSSNDRRRGRGRGRDDNSLLWASARSRGFSPRLPFLRIARLPQYDESRQGAQARLLIY